jgi:hypothetical protein
MTLVFKNNAVEIWSVNERWGIDFWVYGATASGDPRVCPSIGMAYEIAAR